MAWLIKKKETNELPRQETLRLRLGGGKGMEWNGIKGIFLEYSSLLLFGSFNGGNGMYISLFGSLSGRECSFLPFPSKPQIFVPPKIRRNEREWV